MSDTPIDTIEAAIRETLSSRGPMTENDLLESLMADGVDLGSDADDMLADILDGSDDLVMGLLDETFAFIPALLDGRVFTHRLSALEAEHDMLEWGTDLAPVSMLPEMDTYLRLTDGSPVVVAMPDFHDEVFEARGVSPYSVAAEGALLFEPGRMTALRAGAGDLIGLRVTTTGFELVAVDEAPADGVGLKVAEVVDEHAHGPMMLDLAVWTALATDSDLLREPERPLSEQLLSSGLAVDGDFVARGDFAFGVWRARQRTALYKTRYRLRDDEAAALVGAMHLYEENRPLVDAVMDAPQGEGGYEDVARRVQQQQDAETPTNAHLDITSVSETLAFMQEPMFAQAFFTETALEDERAAVALGLFAETMESWAPSTARPALRWLRGKAFEQFGAAEEAEQTFRDAEALDPTWPLTLMSLARLASDRGDAERGLALLRRAHAPADHPLVELLEAFQTPPHPKLARNQPCWCGSGRKYKQCHLHREQLPLEARAGWLYQKPTSFMLEGTSAILLIAVAQERSQYWDSADALERGLMDPLTSDAVLFEGGVFEEFVATRGVLLPADEAMLASQWLLAERSVHEVVSVQPGESMMWRDVRTGDVADIRERTASRQVKPGELYCARVVPVGDTTQIFGGLEPVSLGERDELIALLDSQPGPVELVAFLSRRFAPPVLLNSEGDPIVFCDATLRVNDRAALAAALDDEYDRDDDAPNDMRVWFEHIMTDGMQRIRAELNLHADELRIHTNSEARFERVLATILRLNPEATTLTETREPADFPSMEEAAASGSAPSASPFGLPEDPAMVTALDDMIRQYEESWLEDHIPALGGHTPRECAEDPTRRPDLIRLLNSFPQEEQPGQMSVARLRSALGLG